MNAVDRPAVHSCGFIYCTQCHETSSDAHLDCWRLECMYKLKTCSFSILEPMCGWLNHCGKVMFWIRCNFLTLGVKSCHMASSPNWQMTTETFAALIAGLSQGWAMIIDRAAGEIMPLVASMWVRVCLSICMWALLFEPFDLWPWFLAWRSTLTLASLGL